MSTTVKIWTSKENRPSGDKVSNIPESQMPARWLCESPEYAAELYALELCVANGLRRDEKLEHEIYVEDDLGEHYTFSASVFFELQAKIKLLRNYHA